MELPTFVNLLFKVFHRMCTIYTMTVHTHLVSLGIYYKEYIYIKTAKRGRKKKKIHNLQKWQLSITELTNKTSDLATSMRPYKPSKLRV